MDNEEEDLLDDKHFNDGAEYDELDADAENKLLGSSDEEDNVEYEYVDEEGNHVDINENSNVEYEVVKGGSYPNQNEQDVLDLEIDHDLEFDDSSVNEGSVRDSRTISAELSNSQEQEENDEGYLVQHENEEHFEEESARISDDESESDDEEAGRGRFRSERPNVITLTARNTRRSNIPDSLDEVPVLKDEGRGGYKYQKHGRRDNYDQNRFRDRSRTKDYNSSGRDRNDDDRRQQKPTSSSQEESPSSQSTDKNWPNANNSSANTESHSGPRKILINPHFKGAPPVADVQSTSYWNNSGPQTNLNYNNAYQQHLPPSGPSFNPIQYGAPNPPVPNPINVSTSVRPPLLNSEPQNANDYHWNQASFATSAPPPHVPLPGHIQGNPSGLLDTPPMMFPPPRQRPPPPVLSTDQYFNGNRPFSMRPNHPNQQWNSAPPRLNYEPFNNYDNSSQNNSWNQPQQNQPLISNPPPLVPKFPDLRQPPPSLQMQQPPRPLMNFSSPPPSFTNSRMDAASTSNWIGHRPPPVLGNNFSQLPPPLMGIQPNNSSVPVSMPFRLPLPTPNVPPRFMNPKMSLLGNPVMIGKQRPPNFSPRPHANMANIESDNMNWPRPAINIRQQAVGAFRKRTLEDKTGSPLKQQRTGVYVNKQGTLMRKKPTPVNANIKEVKIVENLSTAENSQTTKIATDKAIVDNEDEETKKYRQQIELLNRKRAEILRIKEERREIMAIQRRKMLMEQQRRQNNNVNLVEASSEMPGVHVKSVLNPKAVVTQAGNLQLVSPQEAVMSPAVKKRVVVIRRVGGATPRPPRKLAPATAVSRAAVSVVAIDNANVPVVPARVITSNAANPVNSFVRTNVIKRVISTSSGGVNLATTQPRQLRTVLLDNKEGNNFPNHKVLAPAKGGPAVVKRPPRVLMQAGQKEGLNTNVNPHGQRIKIVNSNAANAQSTVLIENLSLATSEENLRKLCQSHGPVDKIDLRKDNRTALVKFSQSQDAKSFADRCKRRMVDLSLISVSLVGP